MGWTGVALALGWPWFAAVIWLRRLWPSSGPGVWPMILGYGYLLGQFAAVLVLGVTASLGLAPNSIGPMLVMGLIAVAGARLPATAAPVSTEIGKPAESSPLWHWIFILPLLFWVGLRLAGLALEVWWQPLFPWDAWTTWILRARVWSELHQFVPFVSPETWLSDPGGTAQTIAAWSYPKAVSLLALWPTLGYGSWNETIAVLPWFGCALALGLGFYGQARIWGCSVLETSVFLWMLFSLPILDTHIALAGYADLWLAVVLGLGAAAFFQWSRCGDRRQLLLAFLLMLICPFIKHEGAIWLISFIPALLAARLSGRWLSAIGLATLGAAMAVWISGGLSVALPGAGVLALTPDFVQIPGVGKFVFTYHDSWPALWRNLFVYGTWHLFGYLLVFAVFWGAATGLARGAEPWQRAEMAFVITSLLLFFVLFFLTDAHLWADQATSLNRLLLHFAPAFLFWMLTFWSQGYRRAEPVASAGSPLVGMDPAN